MSDRPIATTPNDVLQFWLGPLDDRGIATPDHVSQWFKKDPAFDDAMRTQFGATHASAARGELENWARSPRGRLALIILLDQFTRNLFRDTEAMFDCDEAAVRLVNTAIAANEDRSLGVHERVFLYMPLMHSESLADQERCVDLMRTLATEAPQVAKNVDFAVAHRDIIDRFGRFPHRNEVMGRTSTEEELVFLTKPGSSF